MSENPEFVARAAVDKLRTRLLPKAAQFYLEKAKGHNDGASLYQDIDETELSGARLQDEAVIELDIAANDATSAIKQQISEALSPEQQGRRDANRAVVGATREWGAQQLDELGLIIDKLIYSIVEQYGEGPSYAGQACLDLLQNGQTTTYAIALLLEHGYLADAEARWRGIYELACSAALLAMAEDVDRTAMRYLVHGRRLPARDPAYKASWATPDFFDMNYEWLREDHPHLNHRGVPKPFRPSWVFSTANLTGALHGLDRAEPPRRSHD